ncbi:mitochondrial carrier domain-containing protein [Rhodocollybia butyracea]|uniref:Mitochondrial carrier domain-containing protein n=1 Tax=Rhodocollybia butyracea TaxID=206335 RepID=A0A9P5PW18_9AGAR|nr:mitochondrial carrier domain-containing protein [Rhodocollybia butyracea]
MSSYARPLATEELVCVWENGILRAERVNGFSDAVRHVWRAEGMRGLWKGAGTTLQTYWCPSSTTYMLTYDHLLKVALPPLIPEPLVPLIAVYAFIPQNPHTLRSVLTSVRGLVRTQGLPVLYRGLGATLWRDIPFSGLYWATYEALKKSFARRGHQGAWVAFTRRQALVMSGSVSKITATFPLVKQIVRTEGASALFAGLTPRIAKIAPACGIMIACFEGVGRFLSEK